MSGRFPKARTVEEMWRILEAGEDAVEEIPADRFDWRKFYGDPQREPGKTDCKWGGFVPGVGEFDPLFFEISPREAELMDPAAAAAADGILEGAGRCRLWRRASLAAARSACSSASSRATTSS